MKIVKEMVTVVTKQRIAKPKLIDDQQPLTKENLYLRLFKGISDGSFSSDEEAAAAIYQAKPADKKYLMLKSRLKERLVNTLFFLDHRRAQDSAYQRAVYDCNRNYFCAKILLTHGARISAVTMAKNTLALARKFDLNEIVMLCAKMLRHHYAMTGIKREYTKFDELAKNSLALIKAETRAEFMYESLLARVSRSKAYSKELAATAKKYFNQSKELSKYQRSFHIYLLHYRIGLLYYQIIRNYRLTLKMCNRLQSFLKKHQHFRLPSREGEIALLKMACCLYLKDYKNGKTNAEEALKFYTQGSNNWFVVMENYFILSMHAGKYKMAEEIFEQVIHHSRFQYLSAEKMEEWKIFEAYLNYGSPDSGKKEEKEFKILKFINEVPIYSKDKEGLYATILIAQILFMIDRGDEDGVEKKVEALRIFSSRHLSGQNTIRTTNFIKLLRKLVNNNYRLERIKVKSAAYLTKLKGAQLSQRSKAEAIEIIPYENIWKLIVTRLEYKRPRQWGKKIPVGAYTS